MDGETIQRGRRINVVFLSAHQAAHYGGYAPAVRAHNLATVLPPGMVEDFHQDLYDQPFFSEVGHA